MVQEDLELFELPIAFAPPSGHQGDASSFLVFQSRWVNVSMGERLRGFEGCYPAVRIILDYKLFAGNKFKKKA